MIFVIICQNLFFFFRGISFKEKLVLYSMIIGGLFAIAIALTVTFYNILGLKSIIEPFLLGLIPAEIF